MFGRTFEDKLEDAWKNICQLSKRCLEEHLKIETKKFGRRFEEKVKNVWKNILKRRSKIFGRTLMLKIRSKIFGRTFEDKVKGVGKIETLRCLEEHLKILKGRTFEIKVEIFARTPEVHLKDVFRRS